MVLQRAEAPPRAINFDGENYVPTIARVGPYRLFFYAGDRDEPPHVHVERDDALAKLWLDPVRLQHAAGFRAAELRQIQRLVAEQQAALLEAWHDYFDG
ncbi:MAG TPA: DUF4160 domain-containing protein [Chloroflexota bacterium]|nr:DUF4160 domain-containing protein [Chloroflexota bacterium]